MSWRDTIQPAQSSGGWRKTIAPLTREQTEEERPAPKVIYEPPERKLEAAAVGAGRGLTLDMLDELIAGGKATLKPGDWQELYNKYLEEERAYQKGLEEQHPFVTTAGQLGGFVVPTTAALKVAKPATALGRAAVEGATGVLQGYGVSEKPEDTLESMALGGTFGFGGSGVFDALGMAAKKSGEKVGDVVGETIFNTPAEVSQALRADPQALDNALSTREMADILASRLSGIKEKVSQLSERALETLKPKAINKPGEIIQEIENLPAKYGIVGTEAYPESQAILKELQLARDVIVANPTESAMKSLLRRLDSRADFNTPSGDAINAVRKEIRSIIDKKLKAENPEYAAAMVPLAEQTGLLSKGIKESRVTRGTEGFEATDRTTQALETLMGTLDKSKKEMSRETLEEIYPGLMDELRKQQLLRRSEGGVTTGSRNVVLGGGVAGSALDLLGLTGGAGVMTGVLAGSVIDKYGRTLGSALARNSGKAGRFLKKYGDQFKGAANKEAVHQLLMDFDQEYVKMFNELEGANQ